MFRTLHEFKTYIVNFFEQIIVNSEEEDLIYYESFKMLNFVEKIFGEVLKTEEGGFDITDEILSTYQGTLLEFAEGIEDTLIVEHVKALLS